jgi:selenocysteine lyase/cysteine desulfurase
LPLSPDQDLQQVKHLLEQEKVMVSVRGTNIRVSINVFNEDQDLDLLMELLDS